MIPIAAMNSGTASVDAIEPNAVGIAGPADDQHEDQPDVVRLPDRAHRVVGVLAHRALAPRRPPSSCQKPGAEVGAAEHGVGGEPERASGRSGTLSELPSAPMRLVGGSSGTRAEPPQDPDDGADEAEVDDDERRVPDRDAARRR